MKRIAVVTATRAEYGLLLPVIRALRARESADFRAELIVTGTHLSDDYGRTEQEIRERIDRRIPISVKNESAADISTNQAEMPAILNDYIKDAVKGAIDKFNKI